MVENEEKEFYNKIGKTIGWNFSSLKCKTIDNSAFHYFDEINKEGEGKIILDIGTGGGEKILNNLKNAKLIIGTDFSKEMINRAKENAKDRNDVMFFEMDSNEIKFPNDFFDIVCARHTPFNSVEVFRVLKSGGLFISEQIDEEDCLDLKISFGRGQGFEKKIKQKEQDKNDLIKCNIKDFEFYDIEQDEYYESEEDLLFLLNNTPIIPDFGKIEKDYEKFNNYVEKNKTDKGIYLKRILYGLKVKKREV